MTTETTTAGTGTTTTDAGEQKTADLTTSLQADGQDTSEQTGEQQQSEGEQKPVVPEAYEFAMPEGVELDTDAAAEYSTFAKELGLTQEQAQKGADIAAKMQQRQAEQHAATVESWIEQVKADKELGGDQFEASLKVASGALDAFGSPELKQLLVATGLGNHPAVIRAFYNAGKKISNDDRLVTGAPAGGAKDTAKTMFPNMN